ncbi:MAG: D-mannonate oxidoreductase [Ignavibacteriae bacterium HGW-Ignavibacteriae-3]|nr:MAG: D-mannonate oxidoreductase [Ignavibacteriae bacterium HGW-Ignavibacteriae-3]
MEANSFADLKDKVCAITGGAGVIGLSLSKALASAGVKMAVLDLNKESADKAAQEIKSAFGIPAIGVEANVLDKSSLEKAKSVVNAELGKIDILINCAGGNSPKATTSYEFITKDNVSEIEKTFYGLDIEGFREVFDLNFLGTVLPTMVLTTDMIESGKGSVINISSMNAFRPLTKIPAYSAAKASINNLTEWLAVHLAKMNIRVNAIAPGFFLTNQNRFLLTDEKTGELTPRGNKIIAGTPMGKFGEPEDLNGALLYLVSDMSSFVTGIVIPVDGGFNAYSGV